LFGFFASYNSIIAHRRRRCQSQLSAGEHLRNSQPTLLPTLTAYCAHCKLPSLIDVSTREINNRSRATSTRHTPRLCKDCKDDQVKINRSPTSPLFKSSSVDWTNVGDKIETWFEKAKTPDQRVVYNFLEQINTDQEKKDLERTLDSAQGKGLDDILNNLKKYRTRFNSARSPRKFNRVFESTSWRVMRHAAVPSRQFNHFNTLHGDDASRDFHISSVFTRTEPRIGSTFLLHPNWV
jgi:hypothetical protein